MGHAFKMQTMVATAFLAAIFSSNPAASQTTLQKELRVEKVYVSEANNYYLAGRFARHEMKPGDQFPDSGFVVRVLESGLVDASFGHRGIVALADADDPSIHGVVEVGTFIYVGGSNGRNGTLFSRLHQNGQVDTTYAVPAVLDRQSFTIADVIPAGNSKIYVILQPRNCLINFEVVRLDQHGALDNTYGRGGIARHDGRGACRPNGRVDVNGKLVIAGRGNRSGGYQWSLMRLQDNGLIDRSFGLDGYAEVGGKRQWGAPPFTLIQDKVFLGFDDYPNPFFVRLDGAGAFDTSFGVDGWLKTKASILSAAYGDGYVYVVNQQPSRRPFIGIEIMRYDSQGVLDTAFPRDTYQTNHSGAEVHIDAAGRVIGVAKRSWSGPCDVELVRMHTDGSADRNFGHVGGVACFEAADFPHL